MNQKEGGGGQRERVKCHRVREGIICTRVSQREGKSEIERERERENLTVKRKKKAIVREKR